MARNMIYVQPDLKREIKQLAIEEGIPMSHLIAKAITLYKARKGKADRAFWYAFKLINSWAMAKASMVPPSGRDQIAQFSSTLRQIRDRLKIRTAPLNTYLDSFRRRPTKELTMRINDLVRDLAMKILAFGAVD